MSIYKQLISELEELQLLKMKELLPEIIDQNKDSRTALEITEILQKLTGSEIAIL